MILTEKEIQETNNVDEQTIDYCKGCFHYNPESLFFQNVGECELSLFLGCPRETGELNESEN